MSQGKWRVSLIGNKSYANDFFDQWFDQYPEAARCFVNLVNKYQISWDDIRENRQAKQAHTITNKNLYRVVLFNYSKPKDYFLTQ